MTFKELKLLVGPDTATIAHILWCRGQTYLAMYVIELHWRAHKLNPKTVNDLMTKVNDDTFKS